MKRVSGGTTTYFGNDPVSPSRMDDTIEEYSSTGTKTAAYLHGIGVDELLGYKTTVWYDYSRDALGSVTRLTDSGGATASTYRYDAFGAIRAQGGSSNTYGFTSRENEASLLYYRARYYDQSAGRFTSSDPSGLCGGYNRYAYVHDNPANRRDPRGLDCAWWDWWCQLQCQTCQSLVSIICIISRAGVAYYLICPLVCAPFAESGIGFLVCEIVCVAVLWYALYYGCDYTADTVCRWAGKC